MLTRSRRGKFWSEIWNEMKFCTVFRGPQRKKPTDFNNPPTIKWIAMKLSTDDGAEDQSNYFVDPFTFLRVPLADHHGFW